MPTTSAGDASRIASVNGLRTNVSSVRRVRTLHCVNPLATGRLFTSRAAGVGRRRPRRSRPRRTAVAVRIGQAAVELRDRADPEVLERFVDGADEADSPTPRHEHDAIAQREVLDRVRREHDGRRPVGQLAQVGDQLRARGRVEAGRRLVEEEHARFGEELDGDAGALALPAAQGRRPGRRRARSARRCRSRHGPRRRPRPRWSTTGAGAGRRSGACVAAARSAWMMSSWGT